MFKLMTAVIFWCDCSVLNEDLPDCARSHVNSKWSPCRDNILATPRTCVCECRGGQSKGILRTSTTADLSLDYFLYHIYQHLVRFQQRCAEWHENHLFYWDSCACMSYINFDSCIGKLKLDLPHQFEIRHTSTSCPPSPQISRRNPECHSKVPLTHVSWLGGLETRQKSNRDVEWCE